VTVAVSAAVAPNLRGPVSSCKSQSGRSPGNLTRHVRGARYRGDMGLEYEASGDPATEVPYIFAS
jgi:hypothetical protein